MEDGAALALASLPGRTGVKATSQEGATFDCDPFKLDGDLLRAYVPRLKLGGVQQLTLRFAVGSQPWRAQFELEQAEYHSFEQAIAELRLIEIERDGPGRQSSRVTLRECTLGVCRVSCRARCRALCPESCPPRQQCLAFLQARVSGLSRPRAHSLPYLLENSQRPEKLCPFLETLFRHSIARLTLGSQRL